MDRGSFFQPGYRPLPTAYKPKPAAAGSKRKQGDSSPSSDYWSSGYSSHDPLVIEDDDVQQGRGSGTHANIPRHVSDSVQSSNTPYVNHSRSSSSSVQPCSLGNVNTFNHNHSSYLNYIDQQYDDTYNDVNRTGNSYYSSNGNGRSEWPIEWPPRAPQHALPTNTSKRPRSNYTSKDTCAATSFGSKRSGGRDFYRDRYAHKGNVQDRLYVLDDGFRIEDVVDEEQVQEYIAAQDGNVADVMVNDHVADVGGLDEGYMDYMQTQSTMNSKEFESKSKTFNIRDHIAQHATKVKNTVDLTADKVPPNGDKDSTNDAMSLTSSKLTLQDLQRQADRFSEDLNASESILNVSIDSLYGKLLQCNLSLHPDSVGHGTTGADSECPVKIPVRFNAEAQYVSIFEPLLLQEVQTALRSLIHLEGKLPPEYMHERLAGDGLSGVAAAGAGAGAGAGSHGARQHAHKHKRDEPPSKNDAKYMLLKVATVSKRRGKNQAGNKTARMVESAFDDDWQEGDLVEVILSNGRQRENEEDRDKSGQKSSAGWREHGDMRRNKPSIMDNGREGPSSSNIRMQRDDLVFVIDGDRESQLGRCAKLSQVALLKHKLAIVLECDDGSRERPSASINTVARAHYKHENKHDKVVKLLFLNAMKPHTQNTVCIVPITSISTFAREWAAVHSVRFHGLMPLAPYVMQAAPVMSTSRMVGIRDELNQRYQQYTYIMDTFGGKLSEVQRSRLRDLSGEMHGILDRLNTLEVNGSLLVRSGMVDKVLRAMRENEGNSWGVKAKELCKKWKAAIKFDLKESTISALAGGNSVRADAVSQRCPAGLRSSLWSLLQERYNPSQLVAIKCASEALPEGGSVLDIDDGNDRSDSTRTHSMQDTRIALIQGPPGTGKTSTIVGIVSAVLSTNEHPPDPDPNPDMQGEAGMPPPREAAKRKKILLCAPSNAAVDEILSRILRNGGVLSDMHMRCDSSIDGEMYRNIDASSSSSTYRRVPTVRLGVPQEGSPREIQELDLEHQAERIVHASAEYLHFKEVCKLLDECDKCLKLSEAGSQGNNPQGAAASSGQQMHLQRPQPSESQLAGKNDRKNDERDLRNEQRRLKVAKTMAQSAVDALRVQARSEVFAGAEIVAGTLSSVGRQLLVSMIAAESIQFDTVVVDEAAQASEPSTLIPLRYGCKRLVLVGDPRQLPATILSPIAERARLGQSLFERLERAGHEVVMLQTQYRMHPAIRQFPADRFYNGMLVDGEGIKDEVRVYMDAAAQSSASLSCSGHGHASGRAALSRSFLEHAIVTAPYVQYDTNEGRSSTHVHAGSQAALGKPSRGLKPANFFNLRNGREEQAGKSFCNPAEADYIAAFLDDLIVRVRQTIPEGMSTNTTIGIISPYKAQVNMLNRRLRRHLHRPHDSHRPSQATAARGPSGGPSGDMNGGREVDVEVNTVDGFQGREKDIIIISCVRCRKDGTSMPGSGGSHAALGAPSDSANANGQRARTKSGIGFVADARRLNVAITRARKCLVIVGSAETLRVDGNWHAMLRSFEARALITPVSVPYTSVLHAL